MGNEKTNKMVEQAAKRVQNKREGPKWMLVLHIRRRANSMKKRKMKQALKVFNMGADYVFLGDKSIKISKKSEISRLI